MSSKAVPMVLSAIDFIEAHLAEKLDLDVVSAGVHYSKYHLHRTFTDTVGLTIHDYVQRRQLTEAAKLLVFSGKSILEIALTAGYESQQAFTGAFTALYKLPPNQYRENEKFYPLQLKFRLEGSHAMLASAEPPRWEITFAAEEDIPCWMDLVRLVIDGFPHLYEEEYVPVLRRRIRDRQALILKEGAMAVGVLLFSPDSGSIDFMGTHPLYRKKGVPRAFLDKVMGELVRDKDLTITTYRAGDRADTGHRKELLALGFAEAELLVEFGYPTQRLVLPREDAHG